MMIHQKTFGLPPAHLLLNTKARDLMKKWIIYLLFSLITIDVTANENCTRAMSNMTVGRVTLRCLNLTGIANFNGTTIQENFDITGSLSATAAHFNNLNAKGTVILDHSIITGITHIQGLLEASDTTFLNDIQITTNSATFKHSTTKNIKVISKTPAQVYLDNNSVVEGNIEFTEGHGVVKNHNSKITGKVMGGKIVE